MPNSRTVVALLLAAGLITACNWGDSNSSDGDEAAAPLSIVVLGDSIASGEGINYGYTYSLGVVYDAWTGGTDNPTWQGQYPLCHDSAQAYGDVLTANVGGKLAKFACTGSTYENGIVYDRRAAGTPYRPAQFGNWLGQTNLNAAYDAAAPDVVVITLGADDVSFVDIVTYCATGYTDAAQVAALAQSDDPTAQLRANFLARFPTAEAWVNRTRRAVNGVLSSSSSYCTAANPGAPIQTLFWDPINSGEIAGNYKALVAAIQARGTKAGKVPHIVFTTYHQPFPTPPQSESCLDLGDLESDEIAYLVTLQNTLKSTIVSAVGNLPGVSVADISGVVKGHEWCTDDPWAYGLSVLLLNKDSQAPFHPTPKGQAAIAAVVETALPAGK
jgi:lysophospholipase L1-like esterase